MASPTTAGNRSSRAAPMAPAERRNAIVNAVFPLVVRNGKLPTSRDIAKAARVSEGTIFNVFTDKEDLLEAVVAAAVDPRALETAISAINSEQSFADRITESVALMQRRVVDVWRVLSIVPHRPLQAKGWKVSPALVELLCAPDAELRYPPTEAAAILRALTISLSNPQIHDDPMAPSAIVDLFLNGVSR